jgi:hypothetical protein
VDGLALVSFGKRRYLINVLAMLDGITRLELVHRPDLSHFKVKMVST